jgi:hypothetical protein
MLVIAGRIRRAPLAVLTRDRRVRDLIVMMKLHVAVTRGALAPRHDDQISLMPPPGPPAIGPRHVAAGAHVPGFTLEIRNRRVISVTQNLIDLGQQLGGQGLPSACPPRPGAPRMGAPEDHWRIR